uniref:LRRCT domain-containing protein n=1 Tax=Caenorhabditis tropicalis TaxID=1561998 RepID=A0A1I7UYE4_9PELO
MPSDVFLNSFLPQPNDRRVIYACGNPWYCNSELEWFRTLLRDNLDIDVEKPGCTAVCASSPNGCPVEGTPLRSVDFCQNNEEAQPLVGRALSMVGWIILAVIMTILLISICLLAMVRYGMSHQRKKQKDAEVAHEEFHAQTTATSIYNAPISAVDRPYSTVPPVNLDLPAAYTLDDRPNNYLY